MIIFIADYSVVYFLGEKCLIQSLNILLNPQPKYIYFTFKMLQSENFDRFFFLFSLKNL